mgnify:CR=1 FL=1
MGEIVKMDNGKDNEIMAMMNDASLCPLLEETKSWCFQLHKNYQ